MHTNAASSEDGMTAKAIGFLRKDLTADPPQDATTIHELADRGFTLVEMLTPGDDRPRPRHLLTRVNPQHRAAAVVIADERHMPAPLSDEVTAVRGVATSVRNSMAMCNSRRSDMEPRPSTELEAVRAIFSADDAAELAIARKDGALWMAVDKSRTWALVDEYGTPGDEFTVVGPTFGTPELYEGDAE
ncbi:hypothetical protein ACWEKR_25360 [Nocardia sp. NPDC004573]